MKFLGSIVRKEGFENLNPPPQDILSARETVEDNELRT